MKKILSLCCVTLLFSLAILADDAPPPPPTPKPKASKSVATRLDVRIDRTATEAKLIIPKSQLKQLRAELEELDDETDTSARVNFTKTQTIISGLFLTLGFIFGGIWLARSRKLETKSAKILVIGAGLFLTGAIATIAYANAGPPPEARSLTNKFFSKEVNIYKFGSGKIKLEVSDKAQNPQLIVPDIQDVPKTNEE